MSALFFCASCGDNLIYISGRRLKCYKCGKYYTENFICRCPRDKAFKFSAEIIAPNKVKCFFCGKQAQVPGNLEPPYMDKYTRDRTGGGGWDGQVGSFQPSGRKPKSAEKPREKVMEQVAEIEKPEVDYISEGRDQIIIKFPGHNALDQIRCEIVNGVLEVQSLLVDFFEKFPLPDFSIELITELRNDVLDIHLVKAK